MKNMVKKVYNFIFRKIPRKVISTLKCACYGAPNTCIFDKKSYVRHTKFEGRNRVNHNTYIINSHIGFGTYIAQNSRIANCKIGRYSLVGFEAMLGAHPLHKVASVHPALYSTKAQYGFTYVDEDSFQEYAYVDDEKKYSIEIGNDVWVTAGATKITQNVRIGDGAIILLDAVVTKDVPPYAIVGGIPAKVIGYRFEPDEIDFLLKIKWWDRSEEWIKEHAVYFNDIKVLMEKVLEEEPDLLKWS